jgi:putative transposase
MTVPTTIDASAWLSKHLTAEDGDHDLARAMLGAFAETRMSAQAQVMCEADYNERSEERVNSRNGYRSRPWDTRVGSIDLAIPKLRSGTYSPEWLLVPRRRAEQALVAVIGQAYVEGISTRRVDDLVKAMGIDGISKSEVSRMAAELDAKVAEFRDRPLDAGPYRYLWIDALVQRVREGGRVVNVSAVIATAVNAEGRREIIGFDIVTTEDTAAWTAFLRSLVARGLSGVELVISDAHGGIKAAIAAVLAEASWQRCRTHYAEDRIMPTWSEKSLREWGFVLLNSHNPLPSAELLLTHCPSEEEVRNEWHAEDGPGDRAAGSICRWVPPGTGETGLQAQLRL